LINVLNHGDPMSSATPASITCILPMPSNVYTGDEEGKVVRMTFLDLRTWRSRKMENADGNQVEWKGRAVY
jgi:hypothetical protein